MALSTREPLPRTDSVTATPPEYAAKAVEDDTHRPEARQNRAQKVSIEDIAAASQQTSAEWVAEMMVYWLLDLTEQYDGIIHTIVQQAAARLVPQYERACQDVVGRG